MSGRKLISRVALLAIVAALCGSYGAWAQRPHPEPPPPKPPKQRPNKQLGQAARNANNPIQEFLRMTPEQRQKALQNLPPGRRENFERRLQQYDQAPPEQKRRLEMLWSLPPERQQQIRDSMRDLRDMPPIERRPVRMQLQRLQAMTPEERETYFHSAEFHRFTPRQQEIMRNLAEIMPPEGF